MRLFILGVKGLLIVVMAFAIISCSEGIEFESPTTNTPRKLFAAIQELVLKEEYSNIETLVYPLRFESVYLPTLVVDCIKTNCDPSNGDLAFSRLGLSILINDFSEDFKSLSEEDLHPMRENPPYNSDTHLMEILDKNPDAFQGLFYSGVNIIIVKTDGQYKLLFWEHLPELGRF